MVDVNTFGLGGAAGSAGSLGPGLVFRPGGRGLRILQPPVPSGTPRSRPPTLSPQPIFCCWQGQSGCTEYRCMEWNGMGEELRQNIMSEPNHSDAESVALRIPAVRRTGPPISRLLSVGSINTDLYG